LHSKQFLHYLFTDHTLQHSRAKLKYFFPISVSCRGFYDRKNTNYCHTMLRNDLKIIFLFLLTGGFYVIVTKKKKMNLV
jgi:hypothetical protein